MYHVKHAAFDPPVHETRPLGPASSASTSTAGGPCSTWARRAGDGDVALDLEPRNRLATSRYIHASTWQVLPWFTLLAALVSLVVIRIVLVTAQSYGLSRYALEMVVRVLVLELIPLSAALFAALRAGMAFDAGAMGLARTGMPAGQATEQTLRRLRRDLVPQVLANAFSVLSLAMVSSIVVLVLAYLNVYGLSPWGLGDYTRTVGRVFDPVVTLGFVFKTVLFGLAVAVIPSASILDALRHGAATARTCSRARCACCSCCC
jgi:phospholipid/cholesterol/gamma-HCH transport system permease protein